MKYLNTNFTYIGHEVSNYRPQLKNLSFLCFYCWLQGIVMYNVSIVSNFTVYITGTPKFVIYLNELKIWKTSQFPQPAFFFTKEKWIKVFLKQNCNSDSRDWTSMKSIKGPKKDLGFREAFSSVLHEDFPCNKPIKYHTYILKIVTTQFYSPHRCV